MEDFSSVSLPLSAWRTINDFVSSLGEHEVKPCVTLVRYGIIPTYRDTSIWNVLPESLLAKLFTQRSNYQESTEVGETFFRIAIDPIISSTIISLCLARPISSEDIAIRFANSASKEIEVMEGQSRLPQINWRTFFFPIPNRCYVLPHQKKDATPFCMRINKQFQTFREKIRNTRIWPYSTSRGVSTEARRSLQILRSIDDVSWMNSEDWQLPISSNSIVKHCLHTGQWAAGRCEMKQKWYPSGLVPRTYFAQGGDAIRVSCYLRNIFNDFTDTYLPTDRYARVDGNRLICPDGGHFLIYDLTSFSSNFHEQKSFLTSMSEFFRGTEVYLIGPGLEPILADVGDMIQEYIDIVNDLPEYTMSDGFDIADEIDGLIHHIAGFLGVPGNLATCTLAHGISIGVHLDNDNRQSCAGDDGNVGVQDEDESNDIQQTIHLLGTFNDEKASSTQETKRGSYLKRPFKQVIQQGLLIERIDSPLMGVVNCMTFDDPRFPELCQDRSKLRERIASSVSKYIRDLYIRTNGIYSQGVIEYITFYLEEVYAKAQLPKNGMVRGVYGSDLDLSSFRIDAAVVFPLMTKYLEREPDQLLSEEFLPWVVDVPVWTDNRITFHENEEWIIGTSRVGQSSSTLEKLVKYGYLDKEESERITLVGVDARRHFRRFLEDDFRKQEYVYTAKATITPTQLRFIGLCGYNEIEWKKLFPQEFSLPLLIASGYRDLDKSDIQNDDVLSSIADLY